MYYFAYGSNMDLAQMKERCPDSTLVGPGELMGYMIDFTIFSPKRLCGCADIVKDENAEVWGLVFKVSDNDMALLDDFEGHPIHYRRVTVHVEVDGKPIECESYEVGEKKKVKGPSRAYLQIMTAAAKEFHFPDSYKRTLATIQTND